MLPEEARFLEHQGGLGECNGHEAPVASGSDALWSRPPVHPYDLGCLPSSAFSVVT